MKSLPDLSDLSEFNSRERYKIKRLYRRAEQLHRMQFSCLKNKRSYVRAELGALIWALNDIGVFVTSPVELHDHEMFEENDYVEPI